MQHKSTLGKPELGRLKAAMDNLFGGLLISLTRTIDFKGFFIRGRLFMYIWGILLVKSIMGLRQVVFIEIL